MLQKRCVRDDKIVWFLHGIISHSGTIFRTYPDEIRFALHYHAFHWAQQGKHDKINSDYLRLSVFKFDRLFFVQMCFGSFYFAGQVRTDNHQNNKPLTSF